MPHTVCILVRDDADAPTILAAITELRAKQRRAAMPSTRDEINVEINRLFDLLAVVA